MSKQPFSALLKEPPPLSLYSGQLCEVPPSPLSLCELADCQNNAPCVERGGRALCQCPPEFGGPRCEKLVSVNFVDRDSYLLLSDPKNWPQANITLQVFRGCRRLHLRLEVGLCVTQKPHANSLCRCPQLRTTVSFFITETMTISQWSSTKATSRSAMTLAANQVTPSTGTGPPSPLKH